MSDNTDAIIAFHHAGVVVPDLDKAIEFYSEIFGFEVYNRFAWNADNVTFNDIIGLDSSAAEACLLKGPNVFLEIFEYSRPDASRDPSDQGPHELGIRHLAFTVIDVKETLVQVVALGGQAINEPVSVPGGATATYCRDPFGNLLELIAPGGRFPYPIQ